MTETDTSTIYFSENDAEIIQILQEEGVLHKLTPTPPYNEAHYIFARQDSWCMATRHVGHADENENGYTLAGLPKICFSREQAGLFFAQLVCENSHGRMEFRDYTLCPVANQ